MLPLTGKDGYATLSIADVSTQPVGAGVWFEYADRTVVGGGVAFCGTSLRLTIPTGAKYVRTVPTLIGSCAPAVKGTVVAVLAPVTPAKRRR